MHAHILSSSFANCIVELVKVIDSKYIKIYYMKGKGALLIAKTKQNDGGPWYMVKALVLVLVLYMFHMH